MIETMGYGLVFVAAATAVTLGCYFLMRALAGATPDSHTKDLAGSVVFRLSALHGLILALVFAQELVEYQQLKYEDAIETNAIADVYFDADRFGAANKVEIQDGLFAYVQTVVNEEWESLGSVGWLSSKAWAQWDVTYNQVLDLVPANDRQRSLRDHMLSQVHVIAETRVKRQNHGGRSIDLMFWVAAIAGIVFIALAYFTFPPTRVNLILISLFGAFTGLIMFFIYAFENPFSSPGTLSPDAHIRLMQQLEAVRAR